MSPEAHSRTKASGVAWLGKIPAHWEVGQSRRLFKERKERARPGDIQLTASQKYGVLSQHRFMELEGQKVVQVLTGHDILKHVEHGDFVISMRSFQGGLEMAQESGCISSAYVTLVPTKDLDPRYFSYLFKSAPYVQALQSTSNLVRDGQALRFSNFALVDLPLVPLPEQSAIAAFLDRETGKIDALVEEQKRLIELLREKRQAVISHAVTKGLDPSAPMKPSGVEWLGDVPEHWEVKRLRDVCRLNPSKSEVSGLPEDFEVSFLPMEAIGDDGSLRLDQVRRLADVQTGYTYFRDGDVTIAKITPCFENGKGALMRGLVGGIGFGTTELIVARCNESVLQPEFLQWVCTSSTFRCLGEGTMYGAGGQKRVPDDYVRGFRIALPPVEEQAAISDFLHQTTEAFADLIATQHRAIELLAERRSALISAAVTGKIDVTGAIAVEEIVA